MNDRQQESLDRLIASLPKDVVPPGNLWPSIAVRLSGRTRRAPPMALAATIALAAAGLASFFTWAVLESRSVPRVIQTVAATSSFEEPRDPKYVLARDAVEKTFRERLGMLEPATRAKIESSLAVIQKAHEDIRKALAADPQSPVLEQLWESTWHDEFDLYDRVVQATQPPNDKDLIMAAFQFANHFKNPVALYALALLASPWAQAFAATSIDEHRPANPQGAVEIENVAGLIDVQGWDKSEVAVTGTVGKDVERVDVTGDANRTSIRVVLPRGLHWGMHDGDAHLVIHVPANSSVSASLVSSDLKVSAVHGALELRTVSGNISGDGGGDLRANDVSGDIHFTATAAKRIEVRSISGSIVLTGGSTDIEASTVSGDARLTLGTVSRARLKTVSGNISATLAAASDAQIDGESVSGDIRLEFAGEPAADFDVQTLSGDIENCFGPKAVEPRHGPGKRLTFKTGDTSARVHLTSNSGEVRLCTRK